MAEANVSRHVGMVAIVLLGALGFWGYRLYSRPATEVQEDPGKQLTAAQPEERSPIPENVSMPASPLGLTESDLDQIAEDEGITVNSGEMPPSPLPTPLPGNTEEPIGGGAQITLEPAPPALEQKKNVLPPPPAVDRVSIAEKKSSIEIETPASGTYYVVKSGDTLSSIAGHLLGSASRSDDIFQANRDAMPDKNRLAVGMKLLIPGATETVRKTPQPTAEELFHTVKRNDSLYSVAVKYYGSTEWKFLELLRRENGLKDTTTSLKAGTRLKIPAAEAAGEVETIATETRTYRVQPGDNLCIISRKVYGATDGWKQIYAANRDKMATPEKLNAGVTLTIPPYAHK
jgi:nucleoid-associated protein YgaU